MREPFSNGYLISFKLIKLKELQCKMKKLISMLMSSVFLLTLPPIQTDGKTIKNNNPKNNTNYYKVNNLTGKLQFEGNTHIPDPLKYDSDWHTIESNGKSISFKINSATLDNNTSFKSMVSNGVLNPEPFYTGITRSYSLANGQEISKSLISTVAKKTGKVISTESSNKNTVSISTKLTISKFLAKINKDTSASYSWETCDKDVSSESVENFDSEKVIKNYSFDGFQNQGYNSLDFYIATAYDKFNVDVSIVENKDDLIINSYRCDGNYDKIYDDYNRPEKVRNYCQQCRSECDYIFSDVSPRNSKYSLYHITTKNGEIVHLLHPFMENYGKMEMAKLISNIEGKRNKIDIGTPSRILINNFNNLNDYTHKEFIDPSKAEKNYSDIINYYNPYIAHFSEPCKYNVPTEEKPDYNNQMVLPNTEKFVKLNGRDYLLRILESPIISKNSPPDRNSIVPIRESIAKGESIKKSSTNSISRQYSHEVTHSKTNEFNFDLKLGSSTLFDFCKFDIGLSTSFKSNRTSISSESNETTITLEEESTYSFPKEFYDKGNSLLITTTNDYITFLVKAEYIPVNSDGSLDTEHSNIIELKMKQPSIKRYSIPINIK